MALNGDTWIQKAINACKDEGTERLVGFSIIIIILLILGSIGILYMIYHVSINAIGMITGGLISTLSSLTSFYWGSSSSSRSKDQTIINLSK